MDIISISLQHSVLDSSAVLNGVSDSFNNLNTVGNELLSDLKSEETLTILTQYMMDRDQPYSTSSLINGINILMELFRRYCSEIEQAEFQQHDYQSQSSTNPMLKKYPTAEKLRSLAVDLNGVFKITKEHVPKFLGFLLNPRSVVIIFDSRAGLWTQRSESRFRWARSD